MRITRVPLGMLIAVLGCGVTVALTGCGGSTTKPVVASSPTAPTFTLLQMNLCLSGIASCYGQVDYPAGVKEAVARIRQTRPDAVTLNEVCSGDVALMARQTGYHWRFSRVIYQGKRLPCVEPGGRGLFGDAVLSKPVIERSETQAFRTQAGPERRVWLCVTTQLGVAVCTAHLASREGDEVVANGRQCEELRAILARRNARIPVIFGGDVNRRLPCAPAGFWIQTDRSSPEDPGSQQVYGSDALRSPSERLLATSHTDHYDLLVGVQLNRRA